MQRRKKVILVGSIYHESALALLAEQAAVQALASPTPEQVRQALSHADAAIVRYPFRIDDETLADASRLAVVASSGRGVDSIDVEACSRRGIAVVNNPGLGTRPVSEHALAMLLALSKRLFEGASTVQAPGAWDRRARFDIMDLHGRTLGIVGLGLIGSEMARKCRAAFDMQVLAYDPHVDAGQAADRGVTLVPRLEDLLRASDVVSIHCELNPETTGLIGEAELRQMRRRALLINTSRGKVVSQAALLRALDERWIEAAALDVYETEPLPTNSPLFGRPDLLLSPHVAGLSGDALQQLAESAARQVLDALAGVRPAHLVNPAAWAARARRD